MSKYRNKKDPHLQREINKYQTPVPSREHILTYLKEMGTPRFFDQIAKDLEITPDQEEGLGFRLKAMIRDGQLIKGRKDAYSLLSELELLKGSVSKTKDGYGFLIQPRGEKDIFISARHMRNIFSGDVVLVRLAKNSANNRTEAIIVEVLERNTTQIAGKLYYSSEVAYIQPDSNQITSPLAVSVDESLNAKEGDYVVAQLQYSNPQKPLSQINVEITDVLGDKLTPGLEIELAIRTFDLPFEFPTNVIEQVKAIPLSITDDERENRKDLTHLDFVTIDGSDAMDFDDAVYASKTKNGWMLYVAIADASHYVIENTPLDIEAINRGNSVYFPGKVIPMLPEKLSNGLCSLRPNEEKLTLVCQMEIDPKGNLIQYDIYEAVMKSKARLTYDNVFDYSQNNYQLDNHIAENIKLLFELYVVLLKKREKRGAIEFDRPEPIFTIDDTGKITAISLKSRNDAHRLIEECMLIANNTIAKYCDDQKLFVLWRNHEIPDDDSLAELRAFLKLFSLKLPRKQTITPMDYAQLLKKIKGRYDSKLLETVVLRSLKQAQYAPELLGHFGLAYDYYAHFTSPIRRYPDLSLHRIIKQFLKKKKVKDQDVEQTQKRLCDLGTHCSMTERRADKATRDASAWLKCDYMQDKVGNEYKGYITEVTSFGIFVTLDDIYIEGLIHISALPNDYYHYDKVKLSLHGKHSNTTFRLGDEISIIVEKVDIDRRKIDFGLAY